MIPIILNHSIKITEGGVMIYVGERSGRYRTVGTRFYKLIPFLYGVSLTMAMSPFTYGNLTPLGPL